MRNVLIISKINVSKFTLNRSGTTEGRINKQSNQSEDIYNEAQRNKRLEILKKMKGTKKNTEKSNVYFDEITEAGEKGQKKYLKR